MTKRLLALMIGMTLVSSESRADMIYLSTATPVVQVGQELTVELRFTANTPNLSDTGPTST